MYLLSYYDTSPELSYFTLIRSYGIPTHGQHGLRAIMARGQLKNIGHGPRHENHSRHSMILIILL